MGWQQCGLQDDRGNSRSQNDRTGSAALPCRVCTCVRPLLSGIQPAPVACEGLQSCPHCRPLQNRHRETVHGGARGTLEISEGEYSQEEQDDKNEVEVENKPVGARGPRQWRGPRFSGDARQSFPTDLTL